MQLLSAICIGLGLGISRYSILNDSNQDWGHTKQLDRDISTCLFMCFIPMGKWNEAQLCKDSKMVQKKVQAVNLHVTTLMKNLMDFEWHFIEVNLVFEMFPCPLRVSFFALSLSRSVHICIQSTNRRHFKELQAILCCILLNLDCTVYSFLFH